MMGTIGTMLAVALAAVICAQMPNVRHSVTELNDAPGWLYAPSSVRLAVPAGVRLELVTMTVVSSDRHKEAALIGILRNRGRAISGAALALSYVGPDGESTLRSVPNAATVSEVPAAGLLPFRFPLMAAAVVPDGVTGFELSITERIGEARRNLPAKIRGEISIRGERHNAALVVGEVEITSDSNLPGADNSRVLVTVLLFDKKDTLLEVLPGVPSSPDDRNIVRIETGSFLPLAKHVGRAEAYVEAIPVEP
jgi:hypothetical protein